MLHIAQQPMHHKSTANENYAADPQHLNM